MIKYLQNEIYRLRKAIKEASSGLLEGRPLSDSVCNDSEAEKLLKAADEARLILQECLYQWTDGPILVVAGQYSEFTKYMQSISRDANTVANRSTKWEVDGQSFHFVNRLNQMQGLRPKEVRYIGTFDTLSEYEDIKQYDRFCIKPYRDK